MVVCYVRLYASLAPTATPSSRVYALLLPDAADSTWAEVDVRHSLLGGFGVFPKRSSALNWGNVADVPVLLCASRGPEYFARCVAHE